MKCSCTSASLLAFSALLWSGLALADDWPQWRGPNRDGISRETGLLKEWPATGPAVVWQVENAGVGFSSVVVKDGRIITQGDLEGVEHILAYDEKDGKLLWAVQPEPLVVVITQRVDGQFTKADKNADGSLDEIEAVTGLDAGWKFNDYDAVEAADKVEIARKRVAALLTLLDKDGNSKLSFAELPGPFQANFDKIDLEDKKADAMVLAEQRAMELLQNDKDLDGKLSREEVRGTIADRQFDKIDEKVTGTDKGDGVLTESELKQYFFSREVGRDGMLSSAELEDYYVKTFPGKDGILTKADLRKALGGYRNGFGDGPRGTPTIDGDRVYVEGGSGDLTCLEAATGKTLWHLDLSRDFGGGRPGWGYCESPLVVGDYLIITPGGQGGTLAALNKNTGAVIWRSTSVTQGAHYASPLVAEIAGIKQIVQFSQANVFGVTLDDGRLLWSYNGANNGTANIATPTIFGDYVLVSSGYGKGAGLAKITSEGGMQKADQIYYQPKLSNHHGGVIKVGDYVYGFGGAWVCMNFLTGDIVWQNRGVGKGALTYADGMLYCLGEGCEVGLIEANPQEYVEHGRFTIPTSHRPAWAHPVIANGRLLLRHQNRLAAYNVKAP